MWAVFEWPAERDLPAEMLRRVKDLLDRGETIVYPTSTLYGLGAGIYSEQGVRKVNAIKSRPPGMPLSIMAAKSQIEELCRIPDMARPFIDSADTRITAVLPARDIAPSHITHRGTLAVRHPCSRLTSSMVEFLGPLTATSANLHGMPAPADAPSAAEQLGHMVPLCIDSGTLEGGPTTFLDYTGDEPKIIREGALSGKEVGMMHER